MAEAPPEKSPLSSKKFIAYLFAEATWKIILLAGLWLLKEQVDAASIMMWWFMLTTVVVAGFLEVAYIGNQAWIDRYVQLARITVSGAAGKLPSVEGPTEGGGAAPSGSSTATDTGPPPEAQ